MLEKEIIHSYNSNPRDPLKSEPIEQNPDEFLETNWDSSDSNFINFDKTEEESYISNSAPNTEDEKYRSKGINLLHAIILKFKALFTKLRNIFLLLQFGRFRSSRI